MTWHPSYIDPDPCGVLSVGIFQRKPSIETFQRDSLILCAPWATSVFLSSTGKNAYTLVYQ